MRSRTAIAAIALSTAVTLTGTACGSTDDPAQSSADKTTPHGYIEGAQEKTEAQTSLAYTAADGKQLHLLDVATEHSSTTKLSTPAHQLYEDGRFVYVGDGTSLEVIDSGGWTVDHVDHVHYYRAPIKNLGTVQAPAPITSVAGAGTLTAIGSADGQVLVVDRKALEDGEVKKQRTLTTNSNTGFAVPYQDGLILAKGSDPKKPADKLVYSDSRGTSLGTTQACQQPHGWAILRNVVAVSCAEGIAMFTKNGGRVDSRLLEYKDRGPRATDITFRPRSNFAAAATAAGAWTINSSTRTLDWTPAPEPLNTAVAPGKSETVVALTKTGSLSAMAIGVGRQDATTRQPGVTDGSTLTVDTSRAYLSAPATKQIHEIDYADALRRARTFPTKDSPELMVEVGR